VPRIIRSKQTTFPSAVPNTPVTKKPRPKKSRPKKSRPEKSLRHSGEARTSVFAFASPPRHPSTSTPHSIRSSSVGRLVSSVRIGAIRGRSASVVRRHPNSPKFPIKFAICAHNRPKPKENRKIPVETRLNPLTIEFERLIVNCGTVLGTRINTGYFATMKPCAKSSEIRGSREPYRDLNATCNKKLETKEQQIWQRE